MVKLHAGGPSGRVKIGQGNGVIQLSRGGIVLVLHREISAADPDRVAIEPGSSVQEQDGVSLLLYRLAGRCV